MNNFRCYKNTVLELPDKGIILLYGTSGIGKTTILKAIHFVITGKENKCVMYGEKKCSVKLEYKDMTITRTKNPNHLILEIDNNKYENDIAQNIIYKRYGEYFNITSYIAQKSIDSFLSMSLNSKLEFFNSIALKNINVLELKEKVRNKIKERKKLVSDKNNEIRILKNQFSNITEPIEINCPFKVCNILEYKDKKEIEKNNFLILSNNLEEYYKKKENIYKVLEQLEEDKIKYEKIVLDKEKNTKLVLDINKDIEDIAIKIEHINNNKQLYTNINKLYDYVKNLFFNNNKIIQKKKDKEEQIFIIKNKIFIIEEKLKNIKSYTEQEQKIYNKIHSLYHIFKDFNNVLGSLSFEKDNLKNFYFSISEDILSCKNKIESNTNNKINLNLKLNYHPKNKLFCPSCKTSLSIIKNEICSYNQNEENNLLNEKNEAIEMIDKINLENNLLNIELETLKNKFEKCKQIIEYEEEFNVYLTINDFKQFYTDFNACINNYRTLKTNLSEYNNNLCIIEKELSSLKENEINFNFEFEFSLLSKICSKDFDMSDICSWKEFIELDNETLYDILEYAYKHIETQNVKLKLLIQQKKDIENKLKDLSIISNIDFNYEYYNEIKTKFNYINKDIDSIKERLQYYNEIEKSIIIYDNFLKEIETYRSLKNKINFCIKEEEVFIKSLNTSETFLKILTDSETVAISNTVDNINYNIKQYTELFFTDFQMQLTPYKETVKGDKKTGIDIEIYQNGEKVSIDVLSGGEFDRCLLVIFLAFNNLTNSDLLLLDECLSSLNSEIVEDIVDVIKSNLNDKLVLVTLHQANTGIFDHVVDVEKLKLN